MAMPVEAIWRVELCVRRHEESGADGKCNGQREDGQEQRPGTSFAFRLFQLRRHLDSLAESAVGATGDRKIMLSMRTRGIEVDQRGADQLSTASTQGVPALARAARAR